MLASVSPFVTVIARWLISDLSLDLQNTRRSIRLDYGNGRGATKMATGDKEFGSGEAAGIEDMVNLYMGAVRSMIDALPAGGTSGEPPTGSREEIMMLLAKAQVAWLTSGLRYWKHIAEIVGKSGLGLVDLATKATDADANDENARTMRQLVLIDKARACLREVGEASMSEAETLRRELMKIEAELRETQSPGQGPEGKRTWRMKR